MTTKARLPSPASSPTQDGAEPGLQLRFCPREAHRPSAPLEPCRGPAPRRVLALSAAARSGIPGTCGRLPFLHLEASEACKRPASLRVTEFHLSRRLQPTL